MSDKNSAEFGASTIKKKLHSLEDFKDRTTSNLNVLDNRLRTLENKTTEAGDNTSALLQVFADKMMAEFRAVQDELQHKLASQVAENKRLQSHLTNQKNEMHAMQKRVLSLEERIKHLELDIGEDDEK